VWDLDPVRFALYLMLSLTAVAVLAAWLVQQQEWRRTYFVLAIANAALTALLFHKLSDLSPWQRLEIISVMVGLALLAVGHAGWYRESEERFSESVSLALFFGCVALIGPLFIATVIQRFAYNVS